MGSKTQSYVSPAVCIVVPVYGVQGYVGRCIDSLLAQVDACVQVILVDDGSLDGSGEICDDYAFRHDHVCVLHQPNGGLSAARNIGIEWVLSCSDCEWITFVDSDDYVEQSYVKTLFGLAVHNDVKCAICGCRSIDSNTNTDIIETNITNIQNIVLEPDCLFSDEFPEDFHISPVSSCMKVFHRSLFDRVRFPRGRTHEDRFTTHRLLFQCDRIAVTNQPLYIYFQSPESIMRSSWTPRRLDDFDAFDEQLDFFLQKDCCHAFKSTCRTYVCMLNSQLEELRETDYANTSMEDGILKLLRERVRIAHDIGAIGNLLNDIECYRYLYPITYIALKRARRVLRLIVSAEYRKHVIQRVEELANKKLLS